MVSARWVASLMTASCMMVMITNTATGATDTAAPDPVARAEAAFQSGAVRDGLQRLAPVLDLPLTDPARRAAVADLLTRYPSARIALLADLRRAATSFTDKATTLSVARRVARFAALGLDWPAQAATDNRWPVALPTPADLQRMIAARAGEQNRSGAVAWMLTDPYREVPGLTTPEAAAIIADRTHGISRPSQPNDASNNIAADNSQHLKNRAKAEQSGDAPLHPAERTTSPDPAPLPRSISRELEDMEQRLRNEQRNFQDQLEREEQRRKLDESIKRRQMEIQQYNQKKEEGFRKAVEELYLRKKIQDENDRITNDRIAADRVRENQRIQEEKKRQAELELKKKIDEERELQNQRNRELARKYEEQRQEILRQHTERLERERQQQMLQKAEAERRAMEQTRRFEEQQQEALRQHKERMERERQQHMLQMAQQKAEAERRAREAAERRLREEAQRRNKM